MTFFCHFSMRPRIYGAHGGKASQNGAPPLDWCVATNFVSSGLWVPGWEEGELPLDTLEHLVVAKLAAHLFEAARHPAAAPRFIEEFCACFDADLAFVGTHDYATGTCALLMHAKPVPAALVDYIRTWCRMDPWLVPARTSRFPFLVWHGDEIVPEPELLQADFYRAWLEPSGLRYWLGGTIAREGEKLTYVALLRSSNSGPFARIDKLRLRRLLPHLETSRRLSADPLPAEIGSSIALDALEHLPFGVIALDGEGKVRYASAWAGEILKQNDGLFLRGDSLRAASNGDSTRLSELIASVLAGRGHAKSDPPGVLAISRPSGARPYVLNVFGHALNLSRGGSSTAAAMVFIHDPEAIAAMDEQMLRTVYQLTPAEAKLAALLSLGRSVSSAASELGITINTARTHLKHLYSKTGTSRQSELVHLFVSMLAIGSSMQNPAPDARKNRQVQAGRDRSVEVA